jgi:hypothetical protein
VTNITTHANYIATHHKGSAIRAGIVTLTLCLAFCLGWTTTPAAAQTAGQGAIQGTVTDQTGAVIPDATITAINMATSVKTVRLSSSAGFYNIAPLPVGTYRVEVSAKGFKTLVQDNLAVNALATLGYNPVLSVGEAQQTVTVTAAPPVLNTTNGTISLTMESQSYANLPIQMNNAQRDPTAFGTLSPGTQGGTRLPIIGGTGNFLGQLYLDGMPAETVSQQGDNRLVSQAVSVDAVDQFQVLTSTPPAEYMGAGAENFTMKSGGLHYHGQVSDFVRNTAFDSWAFTQKGATTRNAQGQTIPAPKPAEHQNELSMTLGGPVPYTGKKVFFFVAYDKFYSRRAANPQLYTVPTDLMRKGDFTQLNENPANISSAGETGTGPNNPAILFNPTTNSCVGSVCARTPFMGTKNGTATYNVIPSAYISPIAQKMESFLPEPTNTSALYNNYFGGYPSGFNNHLEDWRVDWDVSSKQRISTVGAMGAVNYLNNYGSGGSGPTSYGFLPPPYVGGDLANIFPKNYIVSDTYTFSPRVVNQFSYSFTRFFQDIHNATQGVQEWMAPTMGITNLPQGQAGEEFPGAQFGTTKTYGTALTGWTQNGNAASTQLTTPNNYALTDNLQWLKGKHALTVGITYQWQQFNNANPATYTGILSLAYNAFSTANFAAGSNVLNDTSTGFSYASYLLGAVGGSNSDATSAPALGLQPVSELGGRYHPFAIYVQDSYKVTPKLTLDLGLRWDYLPPYQEVKNRWTFLNPNLINPLTGTHGLMQFAGNYGGPGVSCNCRTPVKTYWKNWGPRIGLAYGINNKTVVRAGFAVVYSQAGGVGGRGGAFNGTGQLGFNMTAIGPTEVGTGANAGPSYWLNNSSYFSSIGLANTGLFGPGFTYPQAPTPGVAAQELNTGFYVNSAGKFVSAGSVNYADPYFSSRAPELVLFNFGFERALTQNMTLAVNYVGNESHFIINSGTTGGNARGYWSGQLNPRYLAALGSVTDITDSEPILLAPATAANVAKAAQYAPGIPFLPWYEQAATANKSATIAHMLVPFPQYSGMGDTWGNVGNYNYNSLQITLQQRMANGLTFNANYTFSKNIGDDGTFRSGYPIPAAAISHGTRSYGMDAIERGLTAIDRPSVFNFYGVYQLPFGKDHIGGNSKVVDWLAGNWQLSGIYTVSSGTPFAVTWSGCGSNVPGQGQCMPDQNGAFTGKARINGNFGKGPNGYQKASLGKVQYIDVSAFSTPQNVSTTSTPLYLLGNAPRTGAYTLRNNKTWNGVQAGLRRTFPLHWEDANFIFEADCINVWNRVNFGNPNASWSAGSTTFGTVTSASGDPRDWQFAGHITF